MKEPKSVLAAMQNETTKKKNKRKEKNCKNAALSFIIILYIFVSFSYFALWSENKIMCNGLVKQNHP